MAVAALDAAGAPLTGVLAAVAAFWACCCSSSLGTALEGAVVSTVALAVPVSAVALRSPQAVRPRARAVAKARVIREGFMAKALLRLNLCL